MKKQFQSKAVPRGTRTLWRYLSALILLFSLGIGQMWAAYDVPADGTVDLATKVNNGGRFNVEASGVYHFRKSSGYSFNAGDGIKTQSNQCGVVFYVDKSTEIEVFIKHKEAKNAHTVTVHVYSIPESEYQQFDNNKAGAAESNRTFSTGPSTSSDDSYTIAIAATSDVFSGKKTLASGYYAIVPVGEKSNTYFSQIKFTAAAKTNPTVTFNNGAYTVGGSALNLSTLFSSNSDGAVTYTVKTDGGTTASISGTSFTASAAGTAVVTASQAATSTYNAKAVDANIVVSVPSTPTHGITYNNTKGATNPNPDTYYEGTGVASFEPLADVDGFHFTGWSPASIAADASGDKTINAQWVPAYNVTFSAGAGSGTVPATFQKWEGAKFNLPGQGSMTAPAGKVFDGWKANGAGDKLAADAEYTMGNAAVEFVAQWKAVPQTIYSLTVTNTSEVNLNNGGTQNDLSDDATIVGGGAYMQNDHASKAQQILGSTKLQFKAGTVTLAMTLNTALKEGDTIKATGLNSEGLSFGVTFDRAGNLDNQLASDASYFLVPAAFENSTKLYAWRHSGSGTTCASIQIIRPAAREIASTVITLSDVKVNDHSISSDSLDILKTPEAYALTLGDEFVDAPVIKFNEHTVITYVEGLPATKVTDKVYTVTATVNGDGKWQAAQEIAGTTYTVTAPKASSAKVTYYDGATKLGEETVAIGDAPADYADFQGKDYASFVGWYSNPDLADGHLIADITALTISANTNIYGKWAPAYATSVNVEQWVLDHGVTNATFRAELTARHYKYATLNNLDSLNDDPSKDYRNYAYLGQKVNKTDSEISFLLKNGSNLKVRFGHLGSTINVVYGTDDPIALTSAEYANESPAGDKVYEYTATADVIVKFQCTGTSTSVFKQIMIDEEIAAVTLPWLVTYNAGTGTCATASAVWSGTDLVLPDVTPESVDYTFAGWYDEATGGVLVGAAGASYTPTDNTTLFAHFAPVEYAVNYAAGDHGSGDMAAANVGWGTVYTAVANGFTPETGYIFAGWAVTGVDGVSTLAAGGSFTMPKNPVTLTAIWEDNSKVAQIVETNVKYESLAAAILAAEDDQTIQLLQNIDVTAQVEVAGKAIILDLAGDTINYTGAALSSGVLLVHNGASLTINDSSDPDKGAIISNAAWAALAVTKAGDNKANPAVLEINGGKYVGFYYAITGHGSRPNTNITINNGIFVATSADDGLGIYHPQEGTLTINNGTFEGYLSAIEMRAGTLVINDGEFTATATEFICNPNGGGTTTQGAAIAIAQHTTKKDISVTINGGTFNGVRAINESNPQENDPAPQVTMAVTGGDFTGAITTTDVHEFISGGTFDAPVANENCAYGYVPAPEVAPGVYTVMPKDGVEIIGVVVTGNTTGTVSGLYQGTATVNLNSKKLDSGKYIYVTLKEGYTFEENDVLIVDVDTKSNLDGGTKALEITTGVGNIDGDVWKSIAFDDYTTGENIISLEGIAAGQTSIGLKRSANQNAKINGLRVLRPLKPILTAITIDGRDGVIDEANKTVAVQIPYEANLAALTVVPTIVWNEAAATNSIVVNDGSAWIEGANTYKLTDKDGDYTVYTITLTRDVLKHAVKFYDGETLLETVEVEDGESIDAGDVPADPTKEDYVFQGWAETADGAVVDVTSFTISATKNFYAKWAAETGVIKLLDGEGNVNTTDFITAVTAGTVNFDAADHNCVTFGSTASTVINQSGANKYIVYNARTNQTKIKFVLYNTNSSAQQLVLQKIAEGETAIAEGNEITIDVPSKERFETPYYTYNSDVNRTMYVFTKNTNIKVLQVKVVDDGAPVKQAGEAGYSLNLNVGRVFAPANTGVVYDGLTMETGSNYKVLNSTEFQTLKNISFSIASPVLLKVTTNAAKYYVSQNPDEDGTTATAITAAGTEEISLSTTGTWYLVPSSTSNVKFTNIAFELPKAATPVIETQPATNHTFNPGDMTATVVATVSEGTLHYQWYKKATVGDDEEVGTDAATLTTKTEGTYYVVVTNVLAGHQNVSVTSYEATLGYRVTNDATLMALSYGTPATAITLEDGVYTYAVELAKGTTDVPALAATATMNGYATVTISNAPAFVNYAASSTVTVKSEDLTETNVYTVNFYVKHDLPQVDVTATTTWNWANAAETMQKILPETKDVEQLMANIDDEGKQLKNDAEFNSQALIFSGQEALEKSGSGANTRWFAKGGHIKFNVTVPGIVEVEFSDNGNNNRRVKINDAVSTVASASNTDVKTYKAYVQPGEVTLMGVKNDGTGVDQYIRISKIIFTANPTPDYTRNVSNNIGTLCVDHNVLAGGALGATFYQIAGRNQEYSYKIDFDEVAPGEELKAGEPYIFISNTGRIDLYYTDPSADAVTDSVVVNGMHGVLVGGNLEITEENKLDVCYISENKLRDCSNLVGSGLNLVSNRAYIVMSEVDAAPATPAPGRRRMTISGDNAPAIITGCENLDASDAPVKMLINGQMFILRGEKMYDTTGRLVK